MIKGVNPTFFKNVTYVFNSPPARHDGGLFTKAQEFFFFWPHYVASGILVPGPGTDPGPWQ